MEKGWLKKALTIVASNLIELEDETDNALYFKVRGEGDDYSVRLERTHAFNCTCKWASLKSGQDASLCSHVAAAIIYTAADYRAPAGVRGK